MNIKWIIDAKTQTIEMSYWVCVFLYSVIDKLPNGYYNKGDQQVTKGVIEDEMSKMWQ